MKPAFQCQRWSWELAQLPINISIVLWIKTDFNSFSSGPINFPKVTATVPKSLLLVCSVSQLKNHIKIHQKALMKLTTLHQRLRLPTWVLPHTSLMELVVLSIPPCWHFPPANLISPQSLESLDKTPHPMHIGGLSCQHDLWRHHCLSCRPIPSSSVTSSGTTVWTAD